MRNILWCTRAFSSRSDRILQYNTCVRLAVGSDADVCGRRNGYEQKWYINRIHYKLVYYNNVIWKRTIYGRSVTVLYTYICVCGHAVTDIKPTDFFFLLYNSTFFDDDATRNRIFTRTYRPLVYVTGKYVQLKNDDNSYETTATPKHYVFVIVS